MARKTIPARPTRDRTRDDESMLLRSAEALGRMIGSLQRELEIATGRTAAGEPNGGTTKRPTARRSHASAKAGSIGTRSDARKKSPARRSAKKR